MEGFQKGTAAMGAVVVCLAVLAVSGSAWDGIASAAAFFAAQWLFN